MPLLIHFVGGSPSSTAAAPTYQAHLNREALTRNVAQDFQTLCRDIPPGSLHRVPDCRNESSCFHVSWQRTTNAGGYHRSQTNPLPTTMQPPGILPTLDTRYDIAAIASYRVFVEQRRAGHIPLSVRFQVNLPTTASFLGDGLQPGYQAVIEPQYETALVLACRQIQHHIPHRDLAIQVEVSLESLQARLAGQRALVGGTDLRILSDVLLDRVLRLMQSVDEDVELGVHFCNGKGVAVWLKIEAVHIHSMWLIQQIPGMQSSASQHRSPQMAAYVIADVAVQLLSRWGRSLAWMHLPIPADADVESYITPFRDKLRPKLRPDTELYLGLITPQDPAGSRDRVSAARKVFGEGFGVSTECYLGSRERSELDSVIDIQRALYGTV